MTFLTLDLTAKKWLLAFLVCLFCSWLFSEPGTCSASGMPEPTYTITETELVTLENNLAQLRSINSKLQMELQSQKRELHVLRQESSRLLQQLNELRQQSETQQGLLTAANRSLEEYAIEAKRERLRIKAQRNTWLAVALVAATVAVVK